MKTRNGFVSNSSSSSFVIAVDKPKDGEKLKVTVGFEVDITKYGDEIKTKEDLDARFLEDYSYEGKTINKILDSEPYIRDSYYQLLSAINKGKIVLMGTFSDQGEAVESFLCENGIPKNSKGIEIIQSDGGY
jgi:hypothetical protein